MGSPFDTPFSHSNELSTLPKTLDHLPGFPYVSLRDRRHVQSFIQRELCSDILDTMADKLWWMSKQDSRNVAPLHRQRVKRRQIVVSEDPKLHLVWIEDRIFIKPLSPFLLSHDFWQRHLVRKKDSATGLRIRKAALGFLRTYTHLIRHESDFRIAQEAGLNLIPPDITWKQFCDWASDISRIRDTQVTERYRYGEIRLTRLNFYAPFLIGRSRYQVVDYQYSTYFTRFYGPILFMLAIFSLVLSGFQVLTSASEGLDGVNTEAVLTAGLVVGVGLTVATVCVSIYLCLLVVYKIAREWRVALRDRRARLLKDERAMGDLAV